MCTKLKNNTGKHLYTRDFAESQAIWRDQGADWRTCYEKSLEAMNRRYDRMRSDMIKFCFIKHHNLSKIIGDYAIIIIYVGEIREIDSVGVKTKAQFVIMVVYYHRKVNSFQALYPF